MPGSTGKRATLITAGGEAGSWLRQLLKQRPYRIVEGATGALPPSLLRSVPRSNVVVVGATPASAHDAKGAQARTGQQAQGPTPELLGLVETLHGIAPDVPIVVHSHAALDDADAVLESGATDLIEGELSPGTFYRRLDMAEAYAGAMAGLNQPGTAAAATLSVPLQQLHHPGSGRLDARKVADVLGIPLKSVAVALGFDYAAVHKTPDARRLQPRLRHFASIIEALDELLGSSEAARAWLNRPLAEMEGDTPLAVMLAGEAAAVETLLANVREGVPA